MTSSKPAVQGFPADSHGSVTVEVLLREVDLLKELIFTRLDAIDKATAVFQDNLVRVPTDTDKQVTQLRDFVGQRFDTVEQRFITDLERFAGIQTQFKERDTRVEQTAKTSKEALDAALQAAKEAVGKQNDSFVSSIAKSETATNKQIDQLALLINSTSSNQSSKTDDLKERILRIEGEGLGKQTADNNRQTGSTFSLGVVGLIIASVIGVAGVIVSIIIRIGPH